MITMEVGASAINIGLLILLGSVRLRNYARLVKPRRSVLIRVAPLLSGKYSPQG